MKRYYFLLLALCFTALASAQIDRSKAPASGPAPKVSIGEYESFTLKNGLKVLVVENNKIPQLNISLNIVRDPLLEGDKSSYTHIAGELWGKATEKRNAKQLSEETDFIGANMRTSSTYAGISGLSKFKNQLMEILSDIVLHPSFPKDEFDKIILQTKSGLHTSQSDPASIMNNLRNVTLFGSQHPYGDVITETTVDNITVDDCKNYYHTYIHPNNAILVIVGDITLQEAKTLTEKYLGKWKSGKTPKHEYAVPAQPQGRKVVFSNKDAAPQASIQVSYPIDYHIGMPDQLALNIANQILGGGDFQAKLLKNLREDKGYTYGSYSRISADQLPHAGIFSAFAEVKTNTADSAVTEILKEMQNMTNAEFSDEDIRRVKKTWAGQFSRSLEDPATIAQFAYAIERHKLPKDYYSTFLQRLENVSRDEIIAASKKYFHPENAYILVVTDRSMKAQLARLATDGQVTELDHYGKPVAEGAKISADVTPEKIINTYLQAIGGLEKLKNIKDMTVKSTMNMQGMTIENSYKYLISPEKPMFMLEVSLAGNVMQKMVFDGEKAIIAAGGPTQTIEGEKAAQMREQAYPILELEFDKLGIKPTLEGIEKINGRDAYKLKTTIGEASTYSFYDVENGLKVKSAGNSNGASQEVTFEDYRPTESGLVYPFLNKTNVQGMPIEIKVTQLDVNTGLKAEDFK